MVSTGGDLATMALQDLGLEEICAKVTSREAARSPEAFDVRETIVPAREVAERLAHHITSTKVLDYTSLSDHHSIRSRTRTWRSWRVGSRT